MNKSFLCSFQQHDSLCICYHKLNFFKFSLQAKADKERKTLDLLKSPDVSCIKESVSIVQKLCYKFHVFCVSSFEVLTKPQSRLQQMTFINIFSMFFRENKT